MIPTKKQWNNWTLPSKLTLIGTLVGVLGFSAYLIEKGYGITRAVIKDNDPYIAEFKGNLFPDNADFNSFMLKNINDIVHLEIDLNEEHLADIIKFSEHQRNGRNAHEEENNLPLTIWEYELTEYKPYDSVVYFRVPDDHLTQYQEFNGANYFIDIEDGDDFYFKPRPPQINITGYFKVLGKGEVHETADVKYFGLKPTSIESAKLINK